MKQKKWTAVLRNTAITLVTAAALLALIFCIGRYGWKLAGFRACGSAAIETVTVTDTSVRISGYDPGLFPEGFIGYYAREEDGRLYVGFRFSAVFGFFETGRFDVTIPTETEIKEVYIKTAKGSHLIWDGTETGAAP